MTVAIGEERPEDAAAIAALHEAAFGGPAEARIVDRLRRDGLIVLSLVAIDREKIVGHVLFSRLAVTVDGRPVLAAALAPLAVRPDRQRQRIGSRLVENALPLLRERGVEAVIVVGHPAYYRRFGFSAALARKLDSSYTGEAFMALELRPGALAGRRGEARYPPAFSDAGAT